MKALISQGKGTATVTEIPVPSIADDEILVRNVAVAQNPTDWKRKVLHLVHAPNSNEIFLQTSITLVNQVPSAAAIGLVTSRRLAKRSLRSILETMSQVSPMVEVTMTVVHLLNT